MISLKKIQSRLSGGRQGFTLVELLIVIVVIGILAALVIVTYSGIQQRARDTERKTDLKGIQGQLEAFWADNARYPCLVATTATCVDDLNAAAFRTANLKGLPAKAFADPTNETDTLLCGAVDTDCYGYTVTPAGCDNAGAGDCSNYTLTADLESSTDNFVVQSNN